MPRTEHNKALTSLPLQTLINARHDILHTRKVRDQGSSDFPGQRLSRRRGQGLEFTDLRQYSSGDDVRHIDWNVTARNNEPYTRLYREEREHTTTVAIDLRPSMFSGSNCLRAVSAGRLAASVLWQASEAGDRCAAVVISHRGQRSTRPIAGIRGVLHACELIASEFATANNSPVSSDPPLSTLLNTLNKSSRQIGSYLVFSGFDTDADDRWQQQLSVAGVSRRMTAVLLLDPLETEGLPVGSFNYSYRSQPSTGIVTHANRQRLRDILQQRIDHQSRLFGRYGVPIISQETNTTPTDLLIELQQRSLL